MKKKILSNAVSRSIFFLATFILLLFVGSQIGHLFPEKWERFSYGILGSIAAFVATWIFLKIDRQSFADIGLVWQQGTAVRLSKGLLTGSLIFAALFIPLFLFTQLQLTKNPAPFDMAAAFMYLAIIPLAFMEEIAFRAYPLVRLENAIGIRLTLLVLAIAFALYHVLGGQDMMSSFLGPGIWGLAYGLAAIWSKGIAVPTGMHIAVNILQPMIGMKGAYQSIWLIDFKEGATEAAIKNADNLGIALHLIMLIVIIALTEYYIRKKKQKVE